MNDVPTPVPPPTPPSGPNLGAVLAGLVLVAVGAAVGLHELFGLAFDWRYWAAGVLVLGGFGVVVSSVVRAAACGGHR
ncbi:hypothetical protein [Kineococcus rhizosphaerae]|uniref:Uncharacterized protein n=1 Tax=Kineococcus rhizosphaerae TaxID=559628 RepID=A0A2T0R2M2_9ACTN|nr:hypothetical protein [Kineococcus rhizosphaerae]PRY14034.1 hypothetical protein CLV37_107153 [Kineococcus rhizosphaerae]